MYIELIFLIREIISLKYNIIHEVLIISIALFFKLDYFLYEKKHSLKNSLKS